MKTISSLVIILFAFGLNMQAQMNFEHGSFAEALAKAQSENKKVFVDCYTSWCGPCKRLARDVFPNEDVGEYMNANFINFKIDMEKGEGIELREKFQISAFPTQLILDNSGQEQNRLVGAILDIDQFIAKIQELADPENSLTALREKYEHDMTYAADYLQLVCARGIDAEKESVLMEVFGKWKPKQRYQTDNFKIYSANMKGIHNPVAGLILDDQKHAVRYLGNDVFQAFINNKVMETVNLLYMSHVKEGVSREACEAFNTFAKQYPDVEANKTYRYFAESYMDLCDKNIDGFLAACKRYFEKGTAEERKNVCRFAYRSAMTAGRKEEIRQFYADCIPAISDPDEIRAMESRIERLK